jgi:hypothetical protein
VEPLEDRHLLSAQAVLEIPKLLGASQFPLSAYQFGVTPYTLPENGAPPSYLSVGIFHVSPSSLNPSVTAVLEQTAQKKQQIPEVFVILTATHLDGSALQETWELDNATISSLNLASNVSSTGTSAPNDLGFSFGAIKFTTAHLDVAGHILVSRKGAIDEKLDKIVPPPDFGNQSVARGPSLQVTSTSGAIKGDGAVSVQSYTISTQQSDATSNGQFPVGHASISFLSDLASPGFFVATGPDGSFGALTDALLTVPASNQGMADLSIELTKMSNISITSYETGWSFGDAMPQDTITLDFTAEQMTAQGIYPNPTNVSRSASWDFRTRNGTDPSTSDFGGQNENQVASTLDLGAALLHVTSFKPAAPEGGFPYCFTVTVNHGLASPDLFLASASRQLLAHVVWRGYDSQGRMETWDLHTVGVTSFRTDYVRGGEAADQDTLTLGADQATPSLANAVILGARAVHLLGTPLSLTAQVTGTTGLHYIWTAAQSGQPASNGPDAPTLQFVPSLLGDLVIGLSVSDAYGDTVTAASQTLVIGGLTVSGPSSGTEGQPLTLELSACDPAGTFCPLDYYVSWGDKSSDDEENTAVPVVATLGFRHSYSHSGNYNVLVAASDPLTNWSQQVEFVVQIESGSPQPHSTVQGTRTIPAGRSEQVSSPLDEELSPTPSEALTNGAKSRSEADLSHKDPSPEPHGSPKTDGHGNKGGSGHSPKRRRPSDDKLLDELFRRGDVLTEPLVSDLALTLQ